MKVALDATERELHSEVSSLDKQCAATLLVQLTFLAQEAGVLPEKPPRNVLKLTTTTLQNAPMTLITLCPVQRITHKQFAAVFACCPRLSSQCNIATLALHFYLARA